MGSDTPYKKLTDADAKATTGMPVSGGKVQTTVDGSFIPVHNAPVVATVAPNVYFSVEDPACNIYWVFFFLGLLLFPGFLCCGACGIRSSLHNERMAGKANLIAIPVWLTLVIIFALLSTYVVDEKDT